MYKNIYKNINIVLLPFKDLFFEDDLFYKYLNEGNYDEIKYDLYRKISRKCKMKSYDELDLLLKKIHCEVFNNKLKKEEIYRYYFKLIDLVTKSFYSIRDGKLVYKYWIGDEEKSIFGDYEEGDKIEIFRMINKNICMDIFAVNHILENSNSNILALNNNYSNIELSDLQLDDILSRGISENHIHGNAIFSFSLSWQILMYNNISKKDINKNLNINEYDNNLFKDNPYIYIKLAELIRNLLIVFTVYIDKIDLKNNCYLEDIIKYIETIIDNKLNNSDENKILYYIEKINKEFNIVRRNGIDDIVYTFYPSKDIKTYSENIFLFNVIKYIKNLEHNIYEKENLYFYNMISRMFLYYIRIKNQFYINLVQSNEVKGLDNFKIFFDNGTSPTGYIGYSDLDYYKLMIRSLFQDKYLRNVEVRLSFPRKEEALRKTIKNFLEAYKYVIEEDYIHGDRIIDFPKIGLIFHLIKKNDYKNKEKCIYNFYHNEKSEDLYYEKLLEEYRNNIRNLISIRNKMPELSYFILGIDSANLENLTPTEVFAPIYEEARDSKNDLFNGYDKDGNLIPIKSLRFTYHAGEDFRHILSGLRRIYEVVEYCKFHSGDRVGHGTALGIDIDKWCKENPVIVIPRGEQLNNLLWLWNIYSLSNYSNPRVSLYLENEIYKLSKEIYIRNTGITTPMLYENYINGFKSFKEVYKKEDLNIFSDNLKEVDVNIHNKILCIKSNNNIEVWDSEKLYYSRHCKCYLERMDEPIFVSIKEIDKQMINEAQRILIQYMAKKGIVIEINPTSNLNIGEIDTIFEHQTFNINKIEDNRENIMMTINTDDPMIFNTSLGNEYAYIYYSLIKKGHSKESVLAWINKIRKYSIDTSFIDKNMNSKDIYRFLKNILSYL